MTEYCSSCGSLKLQGICYYHRCPEANNKLHIWIIDGAEYCFREPVTYQEACELAKDKTKLLQATVSRRASKSTFVNGHKT